MNTNKITAYIFSFLFLLASLWAQAQPQQGKDRRASEVRSKLKNAEVCYNNGRPDMCLDTLNPIIKNPILFNSVPGETRAEICRLAALSAFLAKDHKRGVELTQKMLVYQPYYKQQNANKDDINSFTMGVDTLFALPKLKLGVGLSGTIPFVHKLHTYTLLESTNTKQAVYIGYPTMGFSLKLQHQFAQRWGYNIDINGNNYRFIVFDELNIDNKSYPLEFASQINYWEVPASLYFIMNKSKRYDISVALGWFFRYKARAQMFFNDISYTASTMYTPINHGALGSFRFTYKRRSFAFFGDATFMYGWEQINGGLSRYFTEEAEPLLFGNFYALDDIRMSNLNINVGLYWYLNYKVYEKR